MSEQQQELYLKKISGVIERITYQNEENGYTVARLAPDHAQPRDKLANSSNKNNKTIQPRSRATKGDDNLITVVGNMVSVVAGEALELSGRWEQHSQHGWQFKVENYRSTLPATEQGIRKYLGSGLIKGIGPKTAEKIVAYFGTETLDVLENNPDRLIEVPKLGQHKAGLIASAWIEQRAIKEVMVFLQGHGISTSLAVRIYKEYGDKATTIVKNEPYRLARDVFGIGFKTADKIAKSLGYTDDDPERIKAGTLFVLAEASDNGGHTYLPRPRLAELAAELLAVTPEQVEALIDALVLDDGAKLETLVQLPDGSLHFEKPVAIKVQTFGPDNPMPSRQSLMPTKHLQNPVAEPVSSKDADFDYLGEELEREIAVNQRKLNPKSSSRALSQSPAKAPIQQQSAVADGSSDNLEAAIITDNAAGSTLTLSVRPGEQAVYLPPFYFAEQGVASNLIRLWQCPPQKDRLYDLKDIKFDVMFEYLAEKENLKLADRQKDGVLMALTQAVGVLTGGPGTGKTTSMKALIRALKLKKKRVVLAAPTGRAAKRLSEATGLEAKTLHRLLELRPGGKSRYDQDSPIDADIVIIDETSMLDTLLMNSLLKGIATGTHLLLVGDADQLPSVGAGNVLADVINSAVVPVVKLDQIFRQGEGSAIVTNAHLINEGKMPVTSRQITDFFFFPEDDPEKAGDLVVELVAKRIPAKFGFKSEDIQVLAPMHRGKAGVGYLNEKLQESLNAPAQNKPEKQYGNKVFRVGDKVLQLRNNYDKQVYNGDGGTITDINLENQTVKVRLEDDREIEYDFGELDELTLAYAVSIHKSQGSEYPVCVIPVAMGHFMLLERKLIYTAVTRAKKLVVLVGSKKALAIAVRNGPSADGDSSNKGKQQHRSGRYTGLAVRLRQLFLTKRAA